jgi:hypothetical protein
MAAGEMPEIGKISPSVFNELIFPHLGAGTTAYWSARNTAWKSASRQQGVRRNRLPAPPSSSCPSTAGRGLRELTAAEKGMVLVEKGRETKLEHPIIDPFWRAFYSALERYKAGRLVLPAGLKLIGCCLVNPAAMR